MKALFGFFLGFIVAGCASTTGTKVNVGNTPKADLVTLTSKCDKKCTAFIETTFPFESLDRYLKRTLL